ncbi:MAG: hypothetical protein HZC36_01775 [Armatimonadetes bacterium]|nr:hypothetical protein [Armatimonadota bacterium]
MRFALPFCAALIAVAALGAAQEKPRPFGGGGFGRGGNQHVDFSKLDLPPLLKRAIENGSKLRFSGTRVVEFKRGSERRTHTEYIWKDGTRLRITFPADSEFAGQIIVEDENSREHYFPGKNEIEVMAPRREETLTRMIGFMARPGSPSPKFVTGDSETVASQRCTPIAICDPKGNAFARFWIEPRTGMVLKRELYDPAGGVVGSLSFTAVSFRFRPRPGDFDLPMKITGATRLTPEMLARRLMKEKGMIEVFLPADEGFKLEGSRLLGSREKPTLMLFYRGEKGHLTLHQVEGNVDLSRLRGMAGRDLRVYAWQARGRTFALMGQIGEDELKRLAGRIRL